MAITYPITPSAAGVSEVRITQRSVVAVSESPYTLEQQVQAHQGQRWMIEITWPMQKRAVMEPILADFASLNGREGTFLFGDTANKAPRGVATGTPRVNGASQTGYDLVTDGWTSSVAGILKKGDWLQLGSGATARLYKVMLDATSDGSGNATLTLWPRLRSSPADNALIVVNNPVGQWRLTTDGIDWVIDRTKMYGALTVTAAEAL